jgi:putative membrane protein
LRIDPTWFWKDALTIRGAATYRVLPNVLAFGLIALAIYVIDRSGQYNLSVPVGPHEIAGVLLSVLMVARSTAGYERWWEARKLWGGIVNQSRNLAITGLAYGPSDPEWRDRFVRWSAAFCHAARASLRDERAVPELVPLLGRDAAARVMDAQHMPSFVALTIGELLERATTEMGMDRFAFLQADRERATLIDHIGACERIKKTPLARVFSIKVRRFILLFLLTLPFALLHKFSEESDPVLVPLVTMLVAYPLLGLDQIGVELQNPFALHRLSHLPLDEICQTIEGNLLALLNVQSPSLRPTDPTLSRDGP